MRLLIHTPISDELSEIWNSVPLRGSLYSHNTTHCVTILLQKRNVNLGDLSLISSFKIWWEHIILCPLEYVLTWNKIAYFGKIALFLWFVIPITNTILTTQYSGQATNYVKLDGKFI